MSDAPRLGSILYTREQLDARVAALGREASEYYAGSTPVLVTVLKGATMFAADLVRHMSIPHEMDFLALSAYGDGTTGVQAPTVLFSGQYTAGTILSVMVTVAVPVLLFPLTSVAVTSYQPAALTVMVCVLAPLFHK